MRWLLIAKIEVYSGRAPEFKAMRGQTRPFGNKAVLKETFREKM